MSYLTIIKRLISGQSGLFYLLGLKGFFKGMDDEKYLKRMYKSKFKIPLDLEHPKAYTAKLQWLKLHDRKDIYTTFADKVAVRDYVAETLGPEYLVPVFAVYDSVDEIDWEALPQRFILKCSHGSGCNVICPDKSRLDTEKAKKQLSGWMKRSWFWFGREWAYKNITPRILCEHFIESSQGETPNDYKFLCFNGEPKLIQLHMNRYKANYTMDYYDTDWNKTEKSKKGTAISSEKAPMPRNLEKMKALAAILAKDTYFSRIDFYDADGKIYFGEITFFPTSGFSPFDDYEDDLRLGSCIRLPCDRQDGA